MRRDALMMLIGICGIVCLGAAGAAERAVHFPVQKFSIAPLESDLGNGARTSLVMSLPPTNGFAPTVNVRIEPYQGSLDDYLDQTKQQFAKMKWEVIRSEKIDATTAILEFTGTLNDKSVHWFSRVTLKGGSSYLATGTAAADQWEAVSGKLMECANSLKAD